MNRAAIVRALRGTRWVVDRFERLRTKVVVQIHDEDNGYFIAFSMPTGGNWGLLLKEIRAAARRPVEDIAQAAEQQAQEWAEAARGTQGG